MKTLGYSLALIIAAAATFAVKQRTQGLFGCPADTAGSDSYIAYCNTTRYGDYDRGAFYFELEPPAAGHAADADVLFLGNSRLQFGLSTEATAQWFSASGASHYLLGFTHYENVSFIGPLLERIRPRASAYVINADLVFTESLRRPTSRLMHEEDAASSYRDKKRWQHPHRSICLAEPALCGDARAIYRQRDNGHWTLLGNTDGDEKAVADLPQQYDPTWQEQVDVGDAFVDSLNVPRDCVLLTIVPNPETRRAEAEWIAEQLDLTFVAPQPGPLGTFDGSHLDRQSAEAWSASFFDAAAPYLHRCLGETKVESAVSTEANARNLRP